MINARSISGWWALAFVWLLISTNPLLAQPASNSSPTDPMLSLLLRRVAEDPSRADCWRLIGRIHRNHGQFDEAASAFRRALDLAPDNAAAHCDYGELRVQLGDRQTAYWHFDQVLLLAPESSYAQHLLDNGFRPSAEAARIARNRHENSTSVPPPLSTASVPQDTNVLLPVGYEIQTFDGSENLEQGINKLAEAEFSPEPNRVRAFIELGSLYNTNVTLTPTSRELSGEGAVSFQGFLNPDVEWIAARGESWRSGPIARGYFTVNENQFNSLNLTSSQPGVFAERDGTWGETPVAGRLEYIYTLDLLGGTRFGDRHALTASLITIPTDTNVVYAYVTASVSDFADDGTNPAITSLDGPAFSAGVARFLKTDRPLLPSWSYGVDLESALTEGADYHFVGITLHGDTTLQLGERLSFIPSANIGYRDYPDYTGTVSRNEITYRVAGKLSWQLADAWTLSLVVGHDRFASENAVFNSERTEAGILATFSR